MADPKKTNVQAAAIADLLLKGAAFALAVAGEPAEQIIGRVRAMVGKGERLRGEIARMSGDDDEGE